MKRNIPKKNVTLACLAKIWTSVTVTRNHLPTKRFKSTSKSEIAHKTRKMNTNVVSYLKLLVQTFTCERSRNTCPKISLRTNLNETLRKIIFSLRNRNTFKMKYTTNANKKLSVNIWQDFYIGVVAREHPRDGPRKVWKVWLTTTFSQKRTCGNSGTSLWQISFLRKMTVLLCNLSKLFIQKWRIQSLTNFLQQF